MLHVTLIICDLLLFMLIICYDHIVSMYVSVGDCMRCLYLKKSVLWITYIEFLLIVARNITLSVIWN